MTTKNAVSIKQRLTESNYEVNMNPLTDYQTSSDDDFGEDLTPGISQSFSQSGGRTFTKTTACKLLATNSVGFGGLITLAYFLANEYQSSTPNTKVLAAYQLGLGLLTRSIVQVNLSILKKESESPAIQRAIHIIEGLLDLNTQFAVETYLTVYNLALNYPDSLNTTQEALVAWSSFTVAGDLFNVFEDAQGVTRGAIQTINDEPVLNSRFVPSTLIGKEVLNLISASIGVGLLAFDGADAVSEELQPLFFVLGTLLITEPLGGYAMRGFRQLWKWTESRESSEEMGLINQTPTVPLEKRALRIIGNSLREFCFGVILAGSDLVSPRIFMPLMGLLDGVTHELEGRRFEILTAQEVLNEKLNARWPTVQKILTGIFFTGYTAFFTYGLVVSPDLERIQIGVILGTTAVSAIGSRLVYHYFKPGESGRSLNTAAYMVFNPYCLMTPLISSEIVGNWVVPAYSGPSPLNTAFTFVSSAATGAVIGLNQTRPPRRSPVLTSAVFRVIYCYLILRVFIGIIQQQYSS